MKDLFIIIQQTLFHYSVLKTIVICLTLIYLLTFGDPNIINGIVDNLTMSCQ